MKAELKSHAYANEAEARRKRREFINLGFSVSLISQHPSGAYVFDVYF